MDSAKMDQGHDGPPMPKPPDKNHHTSDTIMKRVDNDSQRSKPKQAQSSSLENSRSLNSQLSSWISRFAILGDSPWALASSFLLFLLSLALSLWMDHRGGDSANNKLGVVDPNYDALGPIPPSEPPHVFVVDVTKEGASLTSAAMREAYKRDGVIAVRGLVDSALLERLDAESRVIVNEEEAKNVGKPKRKGNQFYIADHGTIFRDPPQEEFKLERPYSNITGFLELAILSSVPRLATELLALEESPTPYETVRVLRDIFIAKDSDPYVCGWHVDDLGFWPATPESVGVNAWIALDDMVPVERGGGFALAVGSHRATWRDEAHFVTGASTHFPMHTGGYANASDLIQRRTGSGTCNLKQSAPHLNKRMEETKRIYAVLRGDVIFHTRWLFHRTIAFNQERLKLEAAEEEVKKPIYRRYSIRYGPGSAVIPPGYGTELSVLSNDRNGGRTADQVCENDGLPWYPQVWPHVSGSELEGLKTLAKEKLPEAMQLRLARQKEMKPLLRRLAKEQLRPAL